MLTDNFNWLQADLIERSLSQLSKLIWLEIGWSISISSRSYVKNSHLVPAGFKLTKTLKWWTFSSYCLLFQSRRHKSLGFSSQSLNKLHSFNYNFWIRVFFFFLDTFYPNPYSLIRYVLSFSLLDSLRWKNNRKAISIVQSLLFSAEISISDVTYAGR